MRTDEKQRWGLMAVMQIFVSLLMPGLDQITIRQSCGCTQLLHVTKLPVTDTSHHRYMKRHHISMMFSVPCKVIFILEQAA